MADHPIRRRNAQGERREEQESFTQADSFYRFRHVVSFPASLGKDRREVNNQDARGPEMAAGTAASSFPSRTLAGRPSHHSAAGLHSHQIGRAIAQPA
jgi:hypothetical protein